MARCNCNFRTLVWLVVFFWLLGGVVMLVLIHICLPLSPSFTIKLFDDQALTMPKPNNSISPTNLTIHFDLKLKNEDSTLGIHYLDPTNITFSYFPNVSMMVMLANYKLGSFYQGKRKTRHVIDVVETNSFPAVIEGVDMIVFRVDLVGSYKYKMVGSKLYQVELGCVVAVNYTTTQKIQRGFIELVPPGLDSVFEPPRRQYS